MRCRTLACNSSITEHEETQIAIWRVLPGDNDPIGLEPTMARLVPTVHRLRSHPESQFELLQFVVSHPGLERGASTSMRRVHRVTAVGSYTEKFSGNRNAFHCLLLMACVSLTIGSSGRAAHSVHPASYQRTFEYPSRRFSTK